MALPPIKSFPSFCSGTIKPHTIGTGGREVGGNHNNNGAAAGGTGQTLWRIRLLGPGLWDPRSGTGGARVSGGGVTLWYLFWGPPSC